MGNHRKSRELRTLKRTLAVGAIAGTAAGFGVLSALAGPTAFADTCEDAGALCGWFSNNNTPIGNTGNGITNQFGVANGNILNNQTNLAFLSPQLNTATAAQVNTPVNLNVPVAANTQAPVGNGAAVSPAIPIGAALGGSDLAGLNTAAAIPVNAGAAIPIQAPVQTPVLGDNNGDNINTGIGAIQAGENEAEVDDSGDGGNAAVLQSAEGGDAGDTDLDGRAENGNISNRNTATNSATAANNIANNSSTNNYSSNNGNGSTNTVGNDNEND